MPYRASDVTDTHVAWLNDPENVQFSEQRHQTHTLESQHTYVNNHPNGLWLIRRHNNLTMGTVDIGTISAYVDWPNKIANMGILIGKEHWQHGYGLDAWKAVMNYLEHEAKLTKIECGFNAINLGMLKIATKSGMEFDGARNYHFISDLVGEACCDPLFHYAKIMR